MGGSDNRVLEYGMTGAALGRASVYFVTISGGLGLSVAAAFLCVCISLNRYIMSIRWSDGFQGWPFHVFIRPPISLCLLCKRTRARERARAREKERKRGRERERERATDCTGCPLATGGILVCLFSHTLDLASQTRLNIQKANTLSCSNWSVCQLPVGMRCFIFPFFLLPLLFFSRFFFVVTRSDRREGGEGREMKNVDVEICCRAPERERNRVSSRFAFLPIFFPRFVIYIRRIFINSYMKWSMRNTVKIK